MKTKVEKLRDVVPQDLVGIYAVNSHEPEAEREVLMAIIYALMRLNPGWEARILDCEIKDGLRYPDLMKMEKIRFEINHPWYFDGLKIQLEESI